MTNITQNGSLARDDNEYPVMGGTSNVDNKTIINSSYDPITRRLLTTGSGGSGSITVTDGITTVNNVTTLDFTSGATVTAGATGTADVAITSGGTGTVTTVSVVTANGFAGTVANATTTPAITLTTSITGVLKGNGTAISAGVAGDVDSILPTQTGNSGKVLSTNGTNSSWIAAGGTGTVTNVSSADANATVATQTTTPVITIVAAPKLTTARAINGVNFDGTAAITVTAAAGTLTGTTLNSTVVTSSITTLGSSASLPGSPTTTTQSPADNSTKVATTAYVDAAVLGQNFKEAALVATTANLVGVYLSGVFTYTATGTDNIDGVNLVLGNRVLVKNQTTTFQNGIYTVTTAGSIGVAGVLTRSSDANTSGEFKTGDALFVTSGTVNASTTWAYTGVDSPTLGTDAITYAQIAGLGTFVAGNGLTLTGNSFSIDTSITVDKTTAQTLTNKSIVATQLTGTLQAGQFPALTGDITTSAGALATTLATVNGNVGSFTNASITVNGKGLITAASNGTAPVTSVAGTTNRITVTGTTSAVVDIAATYVGQSSITTLGTITTGVWTGTTIAVANGGTGVTSVTTAPAATAFAGWDANKNLSANAIIEGYTTVSAATGTTTLTIASTQRQSYTGTTSQTYVLPTTSIVAGTQYEIQNNSNGVVTVQASNTATIIILGISASATFTALVATPTTIGNWNVNVKNVTASSGKFGSFSNTIAFTGTDNTSFAFPSTNATIARTDAAQTFTGVQTLSSSPILSTNAITGSGANTVTLFTSSDTVVGRATTDTLTNKRITPRVVATTQAAAPAINSDNGDIFEIVGLAQAVTSMTTNLTGTPVEGQFMEIIFKDNGTARGITWGASFVASTVALPTTTVISTQLAALFQWRTSAIWTNTSAWNCVAVA